MRRLLFVSLCAVTFLTGCAGGGSTDTVRSGNGPTQASSDGTVEASGQESAADAAVEPATSPLLYIQGDFEIPAADDGSLSIVQIGEPDPDSGTVPVVVRNMTPAPITDIEVSGTARDGSGGLIGSGSSQGFAPELVNPGEWAFGYVFMDGVKATKDTDFDLTATGHAPDEFMSSVDVEIAEVSMTKSDFGDKLIGILKNPTDEEVGGPVDVSAACFDRSGSLVSIQSGFADSESLAPRGTSSFSIDLFDDKCEQYAMGSSGYDF